MKVAILGTRGYPYVYSGYETLVQHLAEGLVNKGVHVTVYCHRNLFSTFPETVNGVHLVYLPTIQKKSLSQLVHSFLAFVHAAFQSYDAILVCNAANGPFGLLTRWANIPTAINVDGLEWLRPKWKGFGARYFKWAARQACRFYDVIINDSEEMRRVYLAEFGRASQVIAYGGIVRKSTQPQLISQWSLQPGQYYLIVGRLIPDNNADILIEGFTSSNATKKLVVVGDVPYQDAYAERIKGLKDDRLVFTGYIRDQEVLAELYHQAYGYLHGHEFGGTNPTMLKALAYGSAILALNTPFNQEMLQEGRYGRFFEKNAESIKLLVNKVEDQPEEMQTMKEVSSKGITEKYTWSYVVNQYLEVFQSLKKP